MMKFLDDLGHEEMTRLVIALTALNDAGVPLYSRGLHPRYDLTPGQKMRITVDAVMPERRHPLDGVIPARRDFVKDELAGRWVAVDPAPELEPEPKPEPAPAPAPTPKPEPELTEAETASPAEGAEDWLPCGPVDPLPGSVPVQDDAGEGEIILIEQDEAPLVEAAPVGDGASGDVDAQPAEAPAGETEPLPGGEANAPEDGPIVGPLSDTEKQAILLGYEEGQDAAAIGKLLNRKPQTVALFMSLHNRKAVTKIEETKNTPADAPTQPAGASDGGGGPTPAPVASEPAASEPVRARPAPAADPDAVKWADILPMSGTPIRDHLAKIPHKGWALADDILLLEAANEQPVSVVADQLGRDPGELRDRLNLLAGGKAGPRRFDPKAVLFELQAQVRSVHRLRAAKLAG